MASLPLGGWRTRLRGDTARILEAVSLCQTTLTSKIGEVKIDISLIRQDIHKLRERVTETERRIGHVEDEIPPLQVTTERLQYQLNAVNIKQSAHTNVNKHKIKQLQAEHQKANHNT